MNSPIWSLTDEVFLFLLKSFLGTGKLPGKKKKLIPKKFLVTNWINCACDLSCDFLPPVEYFSPIKVSHFEAHFTKLQADSNYLLSKEYEVGS